MSPNSLSYYTDEKCTVSAARSVCFPASSSCFVPESLRRHTRFRHSGEIVLFHGFTLRNTFTCPPQTNGFSLSNKLSLRKYLLAMRKNGPKFLAHVCCCFRETLPVKRSNLLHLPASCCACCSSLTTFAVILKTTVRDYCFMYVTKQYCPPGQLLSN